MEKFDIKVVDLRWGDCPRNGIEKKDEYLKKYFLSQQLTSQPDVFIQVSVPNEFNPVGKYNVGITAGMETTTASAEWIQGCNRMDLVIVPSEHSKKVFETSVYDSIDQRTGQKTGQLTLQKPVKVLFEGADLDVWNDKPVKSSIVDEELSKIKENFCFLFVGHWLKGSHGHDRKDVGKLIETFVQTFKNNPSTTRPALILKTSSATFSVIDRIEMIKNIKRVVRRSGVANPPKVYLLHGDFTQEELNYLYNHSKVKAHVSFTKGEGFGRPLLEASLSGKPVIAPNFSGHVDFLKHSVMLPGNLQNVHKSAAWDKVILEQSQWLYVNYIYASKVLKDVFKNYKKYLKQSKQQATFSKNNFSLNSMDIKFNEILSEHIVEEVQLNLNQPKLNIPKLKRVEV